MAMDHSISSEVHVLTNNAKENRDNNDTNDMTNKPLTSNPKGQYEDIKDQTLALRNQLLFPKKQYSVLNFWSSNHKNK